ncbi:Ger(x)C family spore germination protein [Paenibacillus sp. Root444D2]|uniref:Ger(x)C family spore germination protein n=1 Tax=Paenibacillus sp. Root444D2 TaxID=1736538 RepID=UPI00070A71D5|nr:Ger(x)C family spore germination protein [Paenibacillus sp. Root444D2]KQX44654.1 hypothetical protein ASD40_21910 [Paenibacillus sp. Root444D2]
MRKGIAFLVLSLIIGCSPGTQLEDLAITLSIGIDEEKKGVILTSEILNTEPADGKEKGKKSMKYFLESVSELNIADAISKQKLLHPKEVIPLHNKAIVIGENMLKKGITDVVLDFARTNSIRGGTYLAAAKGKAHDLLQSSAMENQSISDSIIKLINRQGIQTKAVQILEEASGKQQGLIITQLDTIESEGQTRLIISGAAVLNLGKLAGYLDDKEMGLIVLLNNQKPDLRIKVMYKNKPVEVVLGDGQFKLHSELSEDKPNFVFNGALAFNVNKAPLGGITTTEDISNLQILVKNELSRKLISLMRKIVVDYHCDAMGFGDHLYRYHPSYWKKNHNEWSRILPEVKIDFKTEVTIKNVGFHA